MGKSMFTANYITKVLDRIQLRFRQVDVGAGSFQILEASGKINT